MEQFPFLVADEDRKRLGYWLMLCFLQCFVRHSWLGDKKDIWTIEKPVPLILFQNKWMTKK